MKKLIVAAMLIFTQALYPIMIYNNGPYPRTVSLWQNCTEVSQNPDFTQAIKPDESVVFDLTQETKQLLVQVDYSPEPSEILYSGVELLTPASYEQTDLISNDSFILLHQPTKDEPFSIKLVGPKLGAVMQKYMVEIMLEKMKEGQSN